ncbi:MAG: hypothetical protein U0361_24865 [Nitrospiraceae bacterium]
MPANPERWGRVLAELPPGASGNQRIYLADREATSTNCCALPKQQDVIMW